MEELVVFSSELTPQGPIYEAIGRAELGAKWGRPISRRIPPFQTSLRWWDSFHSAHPTIPPPPPLFLHPSPHPNLRYNVAMPTNAEEAEQLRWKKFPVLDDGFVCLVDVMGDDQAVVQAAR